MAINSNKNATSIYSNSGGSIPELRLWRKIIVDALEMACNPDDEFAKVWVYSDISAINYIRRPSPSFRFICNLAAIEFSAVQKQMELRLFDQAYNKKMRRANDTGNRIGRPPRKKEKRAW